METMDGRGLQKLTDYIHSFGTWFKHLRQAQMLWTSFCSEGGWSLSDCQSTNGWLASHPWLSNTCSVSLNYNLVAGPHWSMASLIPAPIGSC